MSDTDDIIKEFLVESYENLDRLDHDLVLLEKDPSSRDVLARIFRSAHTIKGTCGFFGFTKLQNVTHAGENLLSYLRDGVISLTPDITTALLAMVDAVRKILSQIETTGQEGDADYTALINTLGQLLKSSTAAQPSTAKPAASTSAPVNPPSVEPDLPSSGQSMESVLEAAETHLSSVSDTHIRVDVALLDKLMNLVGELVLARNQILQHTSSQENVALTTASQRLNLITSELQENVMKTRMQPIGKIFNKFPRVVRDLAMACGKQVRADLAGEGTELDKTLIEAIADPLTHAVRNAVDHGIEPPDARAAAGKPPEGRLILRAFHESGHVNIEIADDGAGINVEKVRQKALQQGLISQEEASRLSDREIINLIFLPGFSTAEKVTNVSGRGVGMDVVKTNIEKIGGTIDIYSQPGQGTTLKIKIPLTLAIIPALIVTCAGDRYAIPQVSLLELVRLEGNEAAVGIEKIHGVPVYRLRGHLLPLVYLRQELTDKNHALILPSNGTGDGASQELRGGAADSSVNIVVLQAGDRPFGLVVDGVNDTEEIVVKPLGKQLKGTIAFAGATIMGDGRVALILDVTGLALRAHVLAEVGEKALRDREAETPKAQDNRQTLLLFKSPDDGRMAIPLSLVARLEEFPRSKIEKAGDQQVVQYRGEILPLIDLSDALHERRGQPRHSGPSPEAAEQDTVQVVVYTYNGRSVGLVVEHIIDIVEETLAVQSPGSREGVTGSAVIQNRVTELLDVEGIVRAADPRFQASPAAPIRT